MQQKQWQLLQVCTCYSINASCTTAFILCWSTYCICPVHTDNETRKLQSKWLILLKKVKCSEKQLYVVYIENKNAQNTYRYTILGIGICTRRYVGRYYIKKQIGTYLPQTNTAIKHCTVRSTRQIFFDNSSGPQHLQNTKNLKEHRVKDTKKMN